MSGPATIRLQAEFRSALNLGADEIILACPSSPWSQAATIAARKPSRLLIACPEEHVREELVLWLRLKHRLTCRILLAGFLPEEELLATKANRAERFLIHAPGNKYVQLPVQPVQWPKLRDWLYGPDLVTSKIDEEYQPCLRAGFDVNRFRHSLANKFGLKCAWDLQNLIRKKNEPYPEKLRTAVEGDKNLLVSGALHPLPNNDLSRALSERKAEMQAQTDRPSLMGDLAEAVELEVASKLREEVLKEYQLPQVPKDLKVLHIDDELDLGWSDLLRRMIDSEQGKAPGYRPLQPSSTNVQQIKKDVLAAIASDKGEPDVILLDLRLMGEDERLVRPDSPPSGVQVLGAIRHSFKTIPVIVTTASNKLWSLRMVMDRGANAFWIKQGVELNWGAREAVESYLELHNAMTKARHPLVVALRKMERLYAWMGVDEHKWWETGLWANGDRRAGRTSDARRLLGMALQELHEYVRQYLFTPRKTITPEWGISSICNRLGGVAERIIAPELNFYSTAVNGLNRSRHDRFLEVMHVRGDASHGKAPLKINWHVAAGQIHALCAWLRSEGRNGSGTP